MVTAPPDPVVPPPPPVPVVPALPVPFMGRGLLAHPSARAFETNRTKANEGDQIRMRRRLARHRTARLRIRGARSHFWRLGLRWRYRDEPVPRKDSGRRLPDGGARPRRLPWRRARLHRRLSRGRGNGLRERKGPRLRARDERLSALQRGDRLWVGRL